VPTDVLVLFVNGERSLRTAVHACSSDHAVAGKSAFKLRS